MSKRNPIEWREVVEASARAGGVHLVGAQASDLAKRAAAIHQNPSRGIFEATEYVLAELRALKHGRAA